MLMWPPWSLVTYRNILTWISNSGHYLSHQTSLGHFEFLSIERYFHTQIKTDVFKPLQFSVRHKSPRNVIILMVIVSDGRGICSIHQDHVHQSVTHVNWRACLLTRPHSFYLPTTLSSQGARLPQHLLILKVVGCRSESSIPQMPQTTHKAYNLHNHGVWFF